jgi:hypothetical protein
MITLFTVKRHLHRVGIVLSFFLGHWNWDSPAPSSSVECAPSPLVPGEGAHLLAGEGVSQFQRGDIHCGALGIYVLCGHLFAGCNASFDGLVCWPRTGAGRLARIPCTSIEAFRQLQVNYIPGGSPPPHSLLLRPTS